MLEILEKSNVTKCPLLRTFYISIPFNSNVLHSCIHQECEWWDVKEMKCCIRVIAENLLNT